MTLPPLEKLQEIRAALSPDERRLLVALAPLEEASVDHLVVKGGFEKKEQLMSAASWAKGKGLVKMSERVFDVLSIDEEGKRYLKGGLPERRALTFLLERGGAVPAPVLVKDGAITQEEQTIALGWLKRKGWVNFSKAGGETVVEVTDKGRAEAKGTTPDEEALRKLEHKSIPAEELDKTGVEWLKARKAVVKTSDHIERRVIITDLGRAVAALGLETAKPTVGQLTHELLASGKWQDVELRPYDVNAFAPTLTGGRPHPLREMIDESRRIFLEMGFSEIDDDFIQSAFWNMDALFIPQDHPARDIQDTFYVENPRKIPVDDALAKKVGAVHENGGGLPSTGWGYRWSKETAEQALLRTHTTVATIRHLAKDPHSPQKVFCVSRCFRREAVDATHLPEFHQIEGIVVEPHASLSMLKGTLTEFYRRLGFPKVRLNPSYFPYTEPSMEVQVWYNDKWMELGGSGVFRPEVTLPLGIKEPVIAWGHGLERLAMVRFGLKDIRELYVSDIDWLRHRPLLP
jgi:phenylalanyl-tRNA synthetase alpha chain